VPDAAPSWHAESRPQLQDHQYLRNGTAKVLTLFHPQDGQVRLKGVEQTTNAVLHPWLKAELSVILDTLPEAPALRSQAESQHTWHHWRAGLTVTFTLPETLSPLRLLLVWDDLKGHQTPELMQWLCEHGILPFYTPLSGSWLNMAESIQRILKRWAFRWSAS